jgi:YVTN family beta-propeller protein
VSILDVRSLVLAGDIAVGRGVMDMDVRGNQVYCAVRDENAVAVIDTRTSAVTTRIPVANAPLFLGTNLSGSRLVVACAGAGKFDASPRSTGRVAFIDLNTRRVLAQTPISASPDSLNDVPRGLAISDRDMAFVPLNSSFVRLSTQSYGRFIVNPGVNVSYRAITYNSIRNELLLADSARSSCVIADVETGETKDVISLPFRATALYSR